MFFSIHLFTDKVLNRYRILPRNSWFQEISGNILPNFCVFTKNLPKKVNEKFIPSAYIFQIFCICRKFLHHPISCLMKPLLPSHQGNTVTSVTKQESKVTSERTPCDRDHVTSPTTMRINPPRSPRTVDRLIVTRVLQSPTGELISFSCPLSSHCNPGPTIAYRWVD